MLVTECPLQQAPRAPQSGDAAPARRLLLPSLTSHWQGRADYTILDTAFEFGLSFLATWQAWRDGTGRPQRLHYIAFVPRLYSLAALEAVHRLWPQWETASRALRERWPCAVPGWHRILLPDADVHLTLVLGNEMQDLAQLDARVDTFLADDGFFAREARQVRHDLTWFSRLAAAQSQMVLPAGAVDEDALRAAGFAPDRAAALAPFAPRWQVDAPAAIERHAIVIGAGLAGAAIGQRLCARGWQVELIERHPVPAEEASGNLAGIFMPVLARDDNPVARFSRAAFLFALRLWQELGGIGTAFDGAMCGVLQLMREDRLADFGMYPPQFARPIDAEELARRLPGLGVGIGDGAAWLFAQGGWANPASVCQAMLKACGDGLHRRHGSTVARLEREGNLWCAFDEDGTALAQAPHVVLANGIDGNRFPQTSELPLSRIRGQVTHVEASCMPPLTMAVCGDGYVTPAWRGLCSVGASYDMDGEPGLRAASQHENLVRLTTLFPALRVDFAARFEALPLQGRTGFRCVALDRLPFAGRLPDQAALQLSRAERLRDVPRHAGLHALLGLASRGLTWAPLAAELLAAQMSGEPSPLERDLGATLDPARFALQRHRTAKKTH